MTSTQRPSRRGDVVNPGSSAQSTFGQPPSTVRPESPDQQCSLHQQHSHNSGSTRHSTLFGQKHEYSFERLHSLDEQRSPGHLQLSSKHPAACLQPHTPSLPPHLHEQEVAGVSQLPELWPRFTDHTDRSTPPDTLTPPFVHPLQQYPVVPPVLPPVLYQKIVILFENLWLRPAEAARTRLIAVDGFDSRAVRRIIDYLDESIKRNTNLKVRVLGPLACPASSESDWLDYTKCIDQWDSLWKFLTGMRFPSTGSAGCSGQEGRSQASTAFDVNIVPFSPLMITLRWGSTIHSDNEKKELEDWRGLVSDWWGKIRPDITVNVFEANCIPHDPGVVRIVGYYMNMLAVAKVPWEADAVNGLTSGQLRRIEFEVLQWLIQWGASCESTASVQS